MSYRQLLKTYNKALQFDKAVNGIQNFPYHFITADGYTWYVGLAAFITYRSVDFALYTNIGIDVPRSSAISHQVASRFFTPWIPMVESKPAQSIRQFYAAYYGDKECSIETHQHATDKQLIKIKAWCAR